MEFAIRRLTGQEWAEYRDLRLEGLKSAPDAFGSSYEQEVGTTEAQWREKLSGDRAFFGAHAGDQLIGSVNFLRATGVKVEHRGSLLGMYVRPEGRGTGCAAALVKRLIAHARDVGVLQVHLTVGATNLPALRLYQAAGFEIYGTEPRGLMVEQRPIDEHLMVKYLDRQEDKHE